MQLKNSVLKEIRKNKALVRALEDYFEKSHFTIFNVWLVNNNPMLCNINSLKLISAYLKRDIDDLLETTEADYPITV